MTKRLKNKISKSVENTDLKETQLSIQINLDGFSFCIHTLPEKNIIAFQRYEFDQKAYTPEQHLELIKAVFSENELLNQSYKKVIVIHQNELATLVPNNYFKESDLKDYLKNSVKVLDIDFITYDSLSNTETTTVYIPFVNINNFIFNKFGPFEYFHAFSKLIESLSFEDLKSPQDKVFVHVNKTDFEFILFKNNLLKVVNRFDFKTDEDFIYHILFVCEQYKLNTDTLTLILLGEIEKESELYKIAYKYIRNIEFYSNTKKVIIDKTFNMSTHSNYILLNTI